MSNIAWFYLLAILGIIIDLLAAFILFMMFIMPAQAFFFNQFVVICLLFIALFLSSLFGLFTFKKWGRNIFLVLTSLLNIFLLWFFSPMPYLFSIILFIFLFIFIIYFLLPTTRRLFYK